MVNYPCAENIHSTYYDDFNFVKWTYEKYEQMSLRGTFGKALQGLPKGKWLFC